MGIAGHDEIVVESVEVAAGRLLFDAKRLVSRRGQVVSRRMLRQGLVMRMGMVRMVRMNARRDKVETLSAKVVVADLVAQLAHGSRRRMAGVVRRGQSDLLLVVLLLRLLIHGRRQICNFTQKQQWNYKQSIGHEDIEAAAAPKNNKKSLTDANLVVIDFITAPSTTTRCFPLFSGFGYMLPIIWISN